MLCDIMALIAYIRAPSPPKTARAFTPAERFGEAWSVEQAFGSMLGLCPGNNGATALCGHPRSHCRFVPGNAWLRQRGHTGGALSAAEVSCVGKLHPGELGGFPSGGTWASLPPLPGPASHRGLSSSSSSTAAAAASERSRPPSPPDLPSPPQHVPNMASASEEDCCPICLDTCDNTACTMTCLHRFCFDCLWWWAEFKLECPVCRTMVTRRRHLLRGDQFEEFPRTQPSVASLGSTLSWGVSQERQERCLSSVQSWPEYRERWHRNYMALTTSAGFQERGELSPVASTSAVPSRGGTPEPGTDPSATADADELLGTSMAALPGGPSCPPTPIPGEQEELHRELGEAAARVSAPRQARGSSRRGPRRAQKRKTSTRSSDSASRAKKPLRR